MTPVKVGVVGCGNISNIYLEAGKKFDILNIVAVSDLDLVRAQAKAQEHGIARAVSVDELLADPGNRDRHQPDRAGRALRCLQSRPRSGKHAYVEKPLSLTRAQGRDLLETASAKGLRVGGAPDTFLGAALQTCRKLVDDGAIGLPIAATAFMLGRGVENLAPQPGVFL